ncbi:MAG: immunoglobulin domain-containing protein [Verrucomicrobia bacterium]|nr:immunoglobulin domain-containing protein [Verrucomicrobiota bacterium]
MAQAPDSIAGRTIEVTIRSQTGDSFASSGVYDFLTSVDTSLYVIVPVSGDTLPSYGTYTYTRTASNMGRMNFTDISEEEMIEGVARVTFSSSSAGSVVITIPEEPGVEQRGDFVLFSGSAPASIANTVFNVTVTSGEHPFAWTGSFSMTLNSAGTSYTIDGQFPVLDSSGTCTYQKIGTSVGVASLADSLVGSATAHLSFKTATTGTYYVVTGDLDGYQTGVFSMTTSTAPSITQHPVAQTKNAGQTAIFTVAATGTEPLSYQWQKGGADLINGSRISGARSQTLTITGLVEADAGEYRVVVSNAAGSVTSNPAGLTVIPAPRPPVITTQPDDNTVIQGESVTFTVSATGDAPLSYQWFFDDEIIPDETANSLTLTDVRESNAGRYSVLVSNAADTVLSRQAVLSVLIPPNISAEPEDVTVSAGESLTLRVIASGTSPLAYQWFADSEPMEGETSSTLHLSNVRASDAGRYSVVVSNTAGEVTSRSALVTVIEPPVLVIPTFTKFELPEVDVRSTGVAWVDFDGDGNLDAFFSHYDGTNLLYRNMGGGVLERIAGGAVGEDFVTCLGGVWGDCDNDGLPDLFVTNLASDTANVLYRNDGGGVFSRLSVALPSTDVARSVTAAWADYDSDGNLDLFVANSAEGQVNFLYRGLGDGRFTKVTDTVLTSEAALSPCASWADFDNDGDPDLFVTSETEVNRLYRNDGNGSFAKVTSGSVVEDVGHSFGCAWGDYDNDGFADLFIANFENLDSFLYRNNGDGSFIRITEGPVVTDGGNSVGCAWGDVNNDGWLDLFVANESGQNNALYLNEGGGKFRKMTEGQIVSDGGNSRGGALADYDGDGYLDLLVGNLGLGQRNAVYRNAGGSNAWLKVRLVGQLSNRSAIGAKVQVKATIGGTASSQMREISGGTGYGSQDGLEAHFGLGSADQVDVLQIRWPSGIVQELKTVPTKQILTLTEPGRITLSGSIRQSDGAFVLAVNADPGQTVKVHGSEDLANWVEVGEINGNGEMTIPTPYGVQYFRAQVLQ